MKRPIYQYLTDANGYPTGKLERITVERPPTKRGEHNWVAACDKNGSEVFGYCELCGRKAYIDALKGVKYQRR